MAYINAGTLRHKVQLLSCVPLDTEERAWGWRKVRRAWADARDTAGMAIYSNSGVGGRKVTFTLRRQRLDLTFALEWQHRFCLLTSIKELGPAHLEVEGAIVEPVECESNIQDEDGATHIKFPAVLTEKYVGHAQKEPMAENEYRMVLVTPKTIRLKSGSLVRVGDGKPWWVQIPHEMDPYKNEYEIRRLEEP